MRPVRLSGRRAWPWVLVAWTGFLWLSRLRNVLADDDLTSTGRAVRIGVVVVFVALAAAAAWWLRGERRLPMVVLIVWTVGYWMVRGTGILIGDWSVGFKAVHTVLMVVSLGTAAAAAQAMRAGLDGGDGRAVGSRVGSTSR